MRAGALVAAMLAAMVAPAVPAGGVETRPGHPPATVTATVKATADTIVGSGTPPPAPRAPSYEQSRRAASSPSTAARSRSPSR
jgi:hypothetical protein